MLQLIVVLLMSMHLALVDVAMAGPLVCVWLEWRASRHGDLLAGRVGLSLARTAMWALVGGIASGLVLLALRWWLDAPYVSVLLALPPSRLWFGVVELIFSLGCMIAYVGLWNRWTTRRLAHPALAIAAATNLMIHFPSMFAIASVLDSRGEMLGRTLDRAGYQRMLLDSEVLSRVTHVWLAALAVAGVALMGLALRSGQRESAKPLILRGALVGLVTSVLQIPTGLWMTLEMQESARDRLVGGDRIATGLFAIGIALALYLMHSLAAIAQGECEPRYVRRSIATMLLVVLLMGATHCRIHNPFEHFTAAPQSTSVPAAS